MPHRLFTILVATTIILVGTESRAQVPVPNHGFESGDKTPTSWTLTQGDGEVISLGAAGSRAIAVSGNGNSSNAWLSESLPLAADTVYRLRFQARRMEGTSGLAVSGPLFCNRDLSGLSARWTEFESFFMTPHQPAREQSRLRFGQWQMPGKVAFDNVRLDRVIPVYRRHGIIELGAGEVIQGRRYSFSAPYRSTSANHARPLARYQCSFNTGRWQMTASNCEVVYRHRIGRRQDKAQVRAQVGWYQRGKLVVSASRDGRQWKPIGSIEQLGSDSFDVPTDLFPADEIWVRFTAEQKAGEKAAPALQLHAYDYEASIDGAPIELVGATRFVAVTRDDPTLDVAIEDLGDALPGGKNMLRVQLTNRTAEPMELKAIVTVLKSRIDPALDARATPRGQRTETVRLSASAKQVTTLQIPYTIQGVKSHRLTLKLSGDADFEAETTFDVPALHASDYGQALPASTEAVGLWWCSSGWKVSATRPVAKAQSSAMLIRAAANETEAAQMVVRPARKVEGFSVAAGDLTGPRGATIGARSIEVLRVRYVRVTQPTDASSTVGLWPDPLPRLDAPIDLVAGRNQPLWVRVHVPKGQLPGMYTGTIRLRGRGFEAAVPLHVKVYGFALPDRMTCTTAFGFDTSLVWRYHGLKDDRQRREVLDKYFQCLSDHHISPYRPAPLDPIRVTWKNLPSWGGGDLDREIYHAGKASRRVQDTSTTANADLQYQPKVSIPKNGLKLHFWYRTHEPGHRFLVTLQHYDARGNWMSGRNNDLRIEGNGQWQEFEQTIARFPSGARTISLTLRATLWREDGAPTGTVWYDDVGLIDLENGNNVIRAGTFESGQQPIPEPVFDFSDWDRAMTRGMDELHFNAFRLAVPGLGGGTFHRRYEPELLGHSEETTHYKSMMKAYLGQLESHLRAKGWLDAAFVYWFDEPDPKDYAFVMKGFDKLKQWMPGVDRMLTEQVEPALIGGPNIWCPVTSSYNHEKATQRRAKGERFWWYVCTGPKAPYCTLFIDHPGTELRIWLWQTWQRQITGILVWQSNYWTSSAAFPDPTSPQNPYADPMSWVSGYSTPPGTRRPWGNGDGRFLYPPESAANGRPAAPVLEGPVDSMRLEMLRDGIEDYEYLVLLRQLLKKHRAALTAAQKTRLESLLEVPAEITSDRTHFTTDPEPIEQRRHEIALAIEQLARPGN